MDARMRRAVDRAAYRVTREYIFIFLHIFHFTDVNRLETQV